MKIKQAYCTFMFCVLATLSFAQTGYIPSGLTKKDIGEQQIILSSVIVKDNDGKVLETADFLQLLQSENYIPESYVDEQDTVKEIVLRPKTDTDTDNPQFRLNV